MSANPKFGCLLKQVTLKNVTTGAIIFTDDFSGDNLVYLPPKCGQGTTFFPGYGYYVGQDCSYLNTCLDTPPPIQLPDPNPLADVETEGGSGGGGGGGNPQPEPCTSTQTMSASCPVGFENMSSDPLNPTVADSGPTNIQAVLGGLTWKMPVDAGGNCVDTEQSQVVTGQTGITYTVRIRIRALVENKNVGAGVGITVLGTVSQDNSNPYCISLNYAILVGYTDQPVFAAGTSNEYTLNISDPPATYLLNASNKTCPYIRPLDYQFDVAIKAGATVTLRAKTMDGKAYGNTKVLSQTWPDLTTQSIPDPDSDLNVVQPYRGQFAQMDVVSVTGAIGPTPTLPYYRTFTFATAATVDNYTVAVGSGAYPTDWIIEGSNDGGATWTLLDARAAETGGIFQAGQKNRFPIASPSAYLVYRMTVTATSTGAIPDLTQCQLYSAAPTSVSATATATSVSCMNDAQNQALSDAQNLLNCWQIFTATATYTDLSTGVTRSGFAKSYVSQAEASSSALAIAKALATA